MKHNTLHFPIVSFFLYNISLTIRYMMKNFIINFILFIPLGFLTPIIIAKFRNILSCAILGLIISVIISSIAMVIHFIRLDFIDIISMDLLLSNIIGTMVGYGLYCLIFKKIRGQ